MEHRVTDGEMELNYLLFIPIMFGCVFIMKCTKSDNIVKTSIINKLNTLSIISDVGQMLNFRNKYKTDTGPKKLQ